MCKVKGRRWVSAPGVVLPEKYDGVGESESLRISFLEAVYGFRVSFLSLRTFLRYEFDVMAVSGAVCTFY